MAQTFHILLIPKFSMMALSSLIEPMRVANRFGGDLYRWKLISMDGEPVTASNDISFEVEHSIEDVKKAENIIVNASFDPMESMTKEAFGWLRYQARLGANIGALDTGIWILAEAGLMQGHRCTMHWEAIPSFLETYPGIEISLELFEIEENRFTCAGGTAAIDMMLHFIAGTHGTRLAVLVSEQFIRGRIRQQSSPQRMALTEQLGIHNSTLIEAIELMEANIEDPLEIPEIADLLKISRRQLERLFKDHLGDTPNNFYLKIRLNSARQLLQQTHMPVTEISTACGFVSSAHFSRAYSSRFGISPSKDRKILSGGS